MPTFVGLLLFLAFAQDHDCAYARHIGAPLGWVNSFLLVPTPAKIRVFDLMILVVLLVASSRKKSPLVAPMKNALLLVVATMVVWFCYGMTHGGEFRFASWQTYLYLSTVLVAFTVAAVFKTPADYEKLARWLVLAGVYRATMCWISYFTWARDIIGDSGAFLTSHADTVTWVVSILILLVNAVDRRSQLVTARNAFLILYFLGAIQFNSRRIAWVSLTMGVAVLYALFPPGRAKSRMNRAAFVLLPLILTYVIVGWGRSARIFLPLRAFSTVSTEEDSSTLARNAENLGLIATATYSSFFFGTGWGRPYIYLTLKYDISGFELWRYEPHNSILGLLAFTGTLGFTGFWLTVPTAVFLNGRVARLASDPKARNVALVGAAQMIVSCNQFYGDMGTFTHECMYVVAVSYAMALRMPVLAGVWAVPAPRAQVRAASQGEA